MSPRWTLGRIGRCCSWETDSECALDVYTPPLPAAPTGSCWGLVNAAQVLSKEDFTVRRTNPNIWSFEPDVSLRTVWTRWGYGYPRKGFAPSWRVGAAAMVEVVIFSRKDKGHKDKRTFGNGRHHWRLAYFRTGHRYRKWLARLVEPRTICSAEASHPVALLTPTPFPNSLGRQSINPSSTVTVTDHWEWWSWTSTVRNGSIALPEIVWFVFGYSNHQPINGKWTRHSSAIYNGHPPLSV